MSLTLKQALIEARSAEFGGIIVADDDGYTVEELPEGSALIVPPTGVMPIPLHPKARTEIGNLVLQFIQGKLARATGKKIKRRVL